ncbi:MAG: cupin domain-containing protein [Candidatus Rokubacteria bacterium]|nr:cupin domain-containing protein [Candidatus Rokubacteria bacterium]
MDVVDVNAHKGAFFRLLQRTEQSQTAVMTIPAGQDAGEPESHDGDQIFFVIEGEAILTVGDEERRTGPGSLVTIPAGARHHVRNPGTVPLFFLTVYAPPEY